MWFPSPSPEHTHAAARALGRCLEGRGAVIALVGPLGSGKTAFVKGLAAGLGLEPSAVASPTFVIACEYPLAGGGRLGHVDLYRVNSQDELDAAGFLDLLVPDVVLAVEWADRLPAALPADHLELVIERAPELGDDARRIRCQARGPRARALAARWRTALAAAGLSPAESAEPA